MRFKKICLTFLCGLLVLCLASCGRTGAADTKTGGADTKTGDFESPADNSAQYLLTSDEKYTYQFDEKGLCTAALQEGKKAYTFDYEYDSSGRPASRYATDAASGKRSLLETYEYGESGKIKERTETTPKGETVYRYDGEGRLAYCSNLTLPNGLTPYPELFLEYDADGRVTKMTSSTYYLPQEARSASKNDKLQELFPKWSDYLRQTDTWEYSFDDQGRATHIKYSVYYSNLEVYCRTGRNSENRTDLHELTFDYGEDGKSISVSDKASSLRNGTASGKTSEYGPFPFEVAYDGRIPSAIGTQKLDFYSRLSCKPDAAAVGCFGFVFSKASSHFWGETYSGIVGKAPDLQRLKSDGSLSLRITGKDDKGKTAVYLFSKDSMGRSLDYLEKDGLLITPHSSKPDKAHINLYHFEGDEETYAYQSGSRSAASTGIAAKAKAAPSGGTLHGSYKLILKKSTPWMSISLEDSEVTVEFQDDGTIRVPGEKESEVICYSVQGETMKLWNKKDSSFFRTGTWRLLDDSTILLTLTDYSV